MVTAQYDGTLVTVSHKMLDKMRDEIRSLKHERDQLQEALYFIGMDLEAMGLNTDDVEKALGGEEGIKLIEGKLKAQEGEA